MTNLALIQQHLAEHLWPIAEKFEIPENDLINNTELVQLILESQSLAENNEKQNWFNLLPIMNDDQNEKLKEILTREKEKLAEINAKYQQKQTEITQKYQKMFDAEAYYKAKDELEAKEDKSREQDLAEADDLLAQM